MNILVVGGTVFLGRYIVETALANGHTVTLFNRGKTNPDLFPHVEKLKGDRETGDYSALNGRHWDAIIDVSAYYPRAVRELLAAATCDHYTFISTTAVYADWSIPDQDERAPGLTLDDPTTEEATLETYGGLKILCENMAESLHPAVLTVRSGSVMGAHDPSDRFTYYMARVAKGGKMLVPGPPDYLIQLIDVRDEAEWVVRCVENGTTGKFNVGGPVVISDMLETAKTITGSDAEFVWVSAEWCAEHEISRREWPLWIPGDKNAGVYRFSVAKAIAAGLTYRPLTDTIHFVLDWYRTLPPDYDLYGGLHPDTEAKYLALLEAK